MNYFAFFPDLAKKMGDKVGFFAMPKNGSRRYASLGGQGFSISTKAPPRSRSWPRSSSPGSCRSRPSGNG